MRTEEWQEKAAFIDKLRELTDRLNRCRAAYVSTPSGYLKPDGGYVIARGTVYLVGTAYDFPEAGYKQGTYKGVLTAYID